MVFTRLVLRNARICAPRVAVVPRTTVSPLLSRALATAAPSSPSQSIWTSNTVHTTNAHYVLNENHQDSPMQVAASEMMEVGAFGGSESGSKPFVVREHGAEFEGIPMGAYAVSTPFEQQ